MTKPRIYVIPDDKWMNKNGYSIDSGDDEENKIYKYKDALENSDELESVIAKVEQLLSGEKNLDVKSLNNLITSGKGGKSDLRKKFGRRNSKIESSNLENNIFQADIHITVSWTWENNRGRKGLNFIIKAIDPYSGDVLSSMTPDKVILSPTSTSASNLIYEAVANQIDGFSNQLQHKFQDILTNGRSIYMLVGIGEQWDMTMNNSFGGSTLSRIVRDWLDKNVVNHRFNATLGDEYTEEFEDVKIPTRDKNGRLITARDFVEDLQDYLSTKYGITQSTVKMLGMGSAGLELNGM